MIRVHFGTGSFSEGVMFSSAEIDIIQKQYHEQAIGVLQTKNLAHVVYGEVLIDNNYNITAVHFGITEYRTDEEFFKTDNPANVKVLAVHHYGDN